MGDSLVQQWAPRGVQTRTPERSTASATAYTTFSVCSRLRKNQIVFVSSCVREEEGKMDESRLSWGSAHADGAIPWNAGDGCCTVTVAFVVDAGNNSLL